MRILEKRRNKKLEYKILKKEQSIKSILFVIGAFISALSFNLFFVPNNFISGGFGGVAIILNNIYNFDVKFVLLILNVICIIISLFTLGYRKSLVSIVGATVYTAFVYATESIPDLINFSFDDTLLYVLAAGVGVGFGEGLVYKSGFNTGGNSIIALVIQKYKKIPMGKLLRYMGYLIIIAGGFTIGYTAVMYALIISTISTYLIDKIMIGISDSKIFYVHTDKEEEVVSFIIDIIESGVTELFIKGAYSNKKKKMIMCVVPTEKYTFLKNAIKEIDPNAFIIVSDCYEVLGGTKSQILPFTE